MQAPIGWTVHLKGGVVFFCSWAQKHIHTHTRGLSLSIPLFFSFYLSLHYTQFSVQCLLLQLIDQCLLMLARPSGEFTYWKFLRTSLWQKTLGEDYYYPINLLFSMFCFFLPLALTSSTTPDTLTHLFILKLRSKLKANNVLNNSFKGAICLDTIENSTCFLHILYTFISYLHHISTTKVMTAVENKMKESKRSSKWFDGKEEVCWTANKQCKIVSVLAY